MTRRLVVLAFVIGLAVLGSAVYAIAAGDDGPEAVSVGGPQPLLSVNAFGGAQETVAVVTRDTPQSLAVEGVNTLVRVDGGAAMQVLRFVPAGDSDLFVVTFSSQTELNGAGTDDSIEVQALADGVPLNPIGSVGFAGSGQTESHSATFAKRLVGGATGHTYTFRVTWRLFDFGGNNILTGVLDDTTLHVEQSN